ncbi:MAG TPA: hypothetical protein VIL69_08055 [Roseomonas sp.]|jgi:hypothetical protein
MKAFSLLLAGTAALLALSGCGRVGPIRAPGPPGEIIYPRVYPYFPPGTHPGDPPVSRAPDAPAANAPVERGDVPINRPGSPR